jgi:hypothetical protein
MLGYQRATDRACGVIPLVLVGCMLCRKASAYSRACMLVGLSDTAGPLTPSHPKKVSLCATATRLFSPLKPAIGSLAHLSLVQARIAAIACGQMAARSPAEWRSLNEGLEATVKLPVADLEMAALHIVGNDMTVIQQCTLLLQHSPTCYPCLGNSLLIK